MQSLRGELLLLRIYLFLNFKSVLKKKIKFFSFLKINIFLVFLDYFDTLMSKINF